MSTSERFIIAGTPTVLGPLLDILAGDLDVNLVSVTGPAPAPERLVVEMDPDRAEALGRALGDRLLIERDAEIRPF